MKIKEKNIGSSFDAFLREQGIAEEVEEQAVRETSVDRQRRQSNAKSSQKLA